MAATIAQDIHASAHRASHAAPLDSGARLSRALLSYLVVLIAALRLLPFEFAPPTTVRTSLDFSPIGFLAMIAMFVPYGVLTRRSRTGRVGRHAGAILLSGGLLSLVLEAARQFEPACVASPWHVVAAVVGAGGGAWLCDRAHANATGTAIALHALLLQIPLMGLVYLLLPLLWASAAAAEGDPMRLGLTLSVGVMGASIVGSIARAIRAHTPDRQWWQVPLVAATWITIGMVPALRVDWRLTVACIAVVTAFAAWRGRWSAPPFVERRYEAPSVVAASPFMAIYCIGAGIWPGRSFRTIPLVHLGMPTSEAGLALALPLIEAGIAATVLGYMIAEFHGRSEASFAAARSRVLWWAMLILVTVEVSRSFFGFEGASLARVVLSLGAATYGAWLYHLQRDHVKVVAHRLDHHAR